MINPYKTLGISREVSDLEIKRAYFKKIKEFPPETHPEEFKNIRRAYEQLKTLSQRIETDLFAIRDIEKQALPKREIKCRQITIDDLIRMVKLLYGEHHQIDFAHDFNEV